MGSDRDTIRDVSADGVPLANSQEFCQAVLDDIETIFRERYGVKWSPELQQLFEGLRETCIAAAIAVDTGVARGAIQPLKRAVLLSNYSPGSRS